MSMKALVVDDSRAMRRIVGKILAAEGFEIYEAEHGAEALQVLEDQDTGHIDLMCIDWNMPVMNGLELIVAVRKNKEWRNTTLMMVTTESEHQQIVRALAAGAHEYLIKPFTPDSMRDKLQILGLTNLEGS